RADIDAIPEPHDTSAIDPANDIYARYSALIRPFLDANSRVALAIDDLDLRKGTTLVDLSSRQVEQLADLARTTIAGMTLGGGIDEAREIAEVSKQRSAFDQTNRDILTTGEPYAGLIEDVYPAELVSRLSEQLDLVIESGTGDFTAMLEAVNVPPEAGYMGMRGQVADALNERADDLNRAAEARQRWYIALAVATLAVAVVVAWLVSRSITKPLRSLTRQATTMADHRLPEAVLDILDTPLGEDVEVPGVDPVAVPTRDEVSDVAEALNTVQDTALDLAVEQAVLRRNIADSFVNLGRRNQNLLGRQLDFITELEVNETDPDTLANLFRLDHLATRMRRNAESLLVLAGIEPPRKWTSPVRLTDVIRAALGEVEDYQRVSVRGVEP
ncbi:MAG TPA: HAMP domain-containing protein, partial [Acidimicrobiales bacterium]|nr:HAMP domain-containing protein [Acidimicrobiales bacterium]